MGNEQTIAEGNNNMDSLPGNAFPGDFPSLPDGPGSGPEEGGFPSGKPVIPGPGDFPSGNPVIPGPGGDIPDFPDVPDFPGFSGDAFADVGKDFGIDASGALDFANFDESKIPKIGEDGEWPLSGKAFDGFPVLDDAPNFDFSDFDTYPKGFDLTEIKLDFAAVPALVGKLADILKTFAAYEPSKDLFMSLDQDDKKKCSDALKKTLEKIKLTNTLNDFNRQKLADLMAEKKPTKEEVANSIGLSEDDDDVKKIVDNTKVIVEEFGKINFFKDLTNEEILSKAKESFTGPEGAKVKEDLEKGLPKNMNFESFCKLTNKAGFNNQAFKKLLANPSEFKFGNSTNGRRRADDKPATAFSKKQVETQADLAKTQNDEKNRQEDSGVATIAVSTMSIAVSTVAFLFF